MVSPKKGKESNASVSAEGGPPHRMTLSPVTIQITPESKPAIPSWMGEVAAFAQVLTHEGILKTIQDQVRFARARFGLCWLLWTSVGEQGRKTRRASSSQQMRHRRYVLAMLVRSSKNDAADRLV